jgi:hypothetical protein
MAFYRERQTEKMRQFTRKTALFYGERAALCNEPFWQRRAACADGPQVLAFEERLLGRSFRIEISSSVKFENTPVIRGDVVVSTLAVRHETLERPVAYLDEVDIVSLLRQIRPGQSAEAVMQSWSDRLSHEKSWKILQWLWQRRIVVPSPSETPALLTEQLRSAD